MTDSTYISIKNLAEENRPREKMQERGEDSLTNAELLAILIGSGTPKKNAVTLMQEILRDQDDKLITLSRMTIAELMAYNGIGEAKAITIKAAMELGRRRAMEEVARDLTALTSSEKIYTYMRPLLSDLAHEECWVLLLSNSSRLLKRVRISQGGITDAAFDVRIVLKHAILAEAPAIVMVHNHPSGSCRPSNADDQLTRALLEACRTLRIRLLDHVIVTDGDYYSYNDQGKI